MSMQFAENQIRNLTAGVKHMSYFRLALERFEIFFRLQS